MTEYSEAEKNLLKLASAIAVRGYSRMNRKTGTVSDVTSHIRGTKGNQLQVGDQVNTTFGGQKIVQSVIGDKVYFSDGTSGLASATYKVMGGPSSSGDLYDLLAKINKLPPTSENGKNPLDTNVQDPMDGKISESGAILPSRPEMKGKPDGRRI